MAVAINNTVSNPFKVVEPLQQAPKINVIGGAPAQTTNPLMQATKTQPSTYQGSSIVDYLNSSGKASDFGSRTQLAGQYGISNYTGTADQNTQLLNILRGSGSSGTASTGTTGLLPTPSYTPPQPSQPTQPIQPAYTPAPASTPAPAAPISGLLTPPQTQTPQGFQAPNSTPFAQTTAQLSQFDPTKTAGYQEAQAAYQKRVDELKNLQTAYGNQTANIEGTPGYLSLAAGQQGILDRKFLAAQGAAQGAINQQQTALGQALTATGQQEGALSAAAQLAAPQQVSPTNIPFDPVTGKFGQLAGSAATGGGGLAGVGALTEQANQGANVQTMESAVQQSSALINKVKQDILTSGFNPAPSAIGNALSSWINTGLFPNPAFSNVINGLNEIVTTIAPVLGVPGNPTDAKLFMAQQLVPLLMSGKDLPSVLDNLEANARVKINAARTASQGNAVTNPSTGQSVQPTQTNGQSKSIWDF